MASGLKQRSPAWFDIRCGRVTASRMADLMARTKTGWGASRSTYLAQLLMERLTGMVEPSYQNTVMRGGIEREEEACAAYRFHYDAAVTMVGFVLHPDIFMAGASPDGLVADDGLVEIKCPNSATHIETLRTETIPGKYQLQMLWQMACTGRQWCDFVSYDPRFPEPLRLFVKRVERDDTRIAELEHNTRGFIAEVDAAAAALDMRSDSNRAAFANVIDLVIAR